MAQIIVPAEDIKAGDILKPSLANPMVRVEKVIHLENRLFRTKEVKIVGDHGWIGKYHAKTGVAIYRN